MLDEAISRLAPGERPIVHSDRGCYYRWPGWLKRLEAADLTRSMSRKGCTPDNAACEAFFRRLKVEFFYARQWTRTTMEQFTAELDAYIRWYNENALVVPEHSARRPLMRDLIGHPSHSDPAAAGDGIISSAKKLPSTASASGC